MDAGLAYVEGDHATSVRLFSAAAAIKASSGVEVPPFVAGMHERSLAAARSALGDEAVEAVRRSGAGLETHAAAEAIAWSNGLR